MKKEKRFFKNPVFRSILTTILPFVWFLGLDLGFRFLYTLAVCYPWDNGPAMIFSLCWSGLFTALLLLLPRLLRRIFMVLLTVLSCVIALVHAALYNLVGTYFSWADLSFAGEGARFFSFSYLHFRIGLILLVIAVLALCILTVWLVPKTRYRWYRPVIALVMAGVCVWGIHLQDQIFRESTSEAASWTMTTYDPTTDEAVYSNFSDINRVFHMSGSYQYMYRNILVSTGLEDLLRNGEQYEKLDKFYAEREEHQPNNWTGAFAGKNLILIQLESVDTWMLTEDFMPNLYRLQQEGVDWADNYTPLFSSAATFNTELIVNTGLIIPPTGVAAKTYTQYPIPYSLPHIFEKAGYRCETFHPSFGYIYNRQEIHGNWGYTAYHDYQSMHMEDYMRDSQMIGGYEDMVSNEPFVSFIITYSGHGPYTEEMDNISEGHWEKVYDLIDPETIPGSEADRQEYLRAIAHAMETDDFIGALVDRLEADGHIDDTVLFIYSDHYGKYMTNTDLVMQLKGARNADELTKTPCFFYSKGTAPEKVEKAASSLDVLPTIANLFGLDTEYRYYAGRDVFSDGPGLVMFRNYDWYDGETWHMAGSSGGEETTARVQQILDCTWSALKCNYFAHLEEES